MLQGQAPTEHVPETLQQLVAPHIDSFNYFVSEGLSEVVRRLPPAEVKFSDNYWPIRKLCQSVFMQLSHKLAAKAGVAGRAG